MTDSQLNINIQDLKISSQRIKYDWYQTDSYIIVTILAKSTTNVKVTYSKTMINVYAKLSNGNDYSLELSLAYYIVPDECFHKVVCSKIEINLRKQEGLRWTTLEGKSVNHNEEENHKEILQIVNQSPRYPSSCKNAKDWDKVEKEIIKQEAEDNEIDEGALSELFQQIYGKGTDEVRRAMNKSFQESGGTVLSTNWSEVGKGKVEIQPPDGLEWKSWDS